MNTQKPYHEFVFNTKERKFVGKFENMYINEDIKKYDSWSQEDSTHLGRQLSFLILDRFNFGSILDIGCGKGAFTHILKKENNRVVGIDISKTAISKARLKYGGIEFRIMDIEDAINNVDRFDLIVMMEILSYLKNWKKVIEKAAKKSEYIYISLYLPSNPIGFIKKFNDLKNQVEKTVV